MPQPSDERLHNNTSILLQGVWNKKQSKLQTSSSQPFSAHSSRHTVHFHLNTHRQTENMKYVLILTVASFAIAAAMARPNDHMMDKRHGTAAAAASASAASSSGHKGKGTKNKTTTEAATTAPSATTTGQPISLPTGQPVPTHPSNCAPGQTTVAATLVPTAGPTTPLTASTGINIQTTTPLPGSTVTAETTTATTPLVIATGATDSATTEVPTTTTAQPTTPDE